MVENGVPHGDGLRRTHADRWKTLRLAPSPDRSGWKTGKMSTNPHPLAFGRWCCYNREVASLDRFQAQPIRENPVHTTTHEKRSPRLRESTMIDADRSIVVRTRPFGKNTVALKTRAKEHFPKPFIG